MTIFCRFGAKMMTLPSPRLRAQSQTGAFPEPSSLLMGLVSKTEQTHHHWLYSLRLYYTNISQILLLITQRGAEGMKGGLKSTGT